jgi:hypothetical protein
MQFSQILKQFRDVAVAPGSAEQASGVENAGTVTPAVAQTPHVDVDLSEESMVVEPANVSVETLFGGKTHAESTLEENRRALTNFVKLAEWGNSPDAEAIARRIDQALSDFPELEFDYRRSELAGNVVGKVLPPLRGLKIAQILAPEDEEIAERLLIALSRDSDWEALRDRLASFKPGEDIDVLIAQIVSEMNDLANPIGASATLGALCSRLTNIRSLAALRIAHARARLLLRRNGAEDTAFAAAVFPSWRLVERYRRPAASQVLENRRPIGFATFDTSRMRRLERVVATHLKQRVAENADRLPVRVRRSNPVPWSVITLERRGSVTIPARKFSSDYACREKGVIRAKRHPIASPFVYGPYITLVEGFYTLQFLGDGDDRLEYELAATNNMGQYKLATSRIILMKDANDGVLGELNFNVARQSDGFEFIIYALGERGTINFRGVSLIKRK